MYLLFEGTKDKIVFDLPSMQITFFIFTKSQHNKIAFNSEVTRPGNALQIERRNEDRIDLNHAALNPDVLLLTCDSVNITPQVENLLSRVLVRPQLFHFCKAKGILTIPGSAIEDRQYQVDTSGLGIFSGRWCDIERKSEKPSKPLLKTMGENPALEWNTVESLSAGIQFNLLIFSLQSDFPKT